MTDESILDRIQADMTAAMKARDADTLSTLRMLKAGLLEERTKPDKTGLTRDEEVQVVQRYVRKRRETIEEVKRLGRADLVPKEEKEIAVASRYLPQALTEDEVRAMVADAIARTGATSQKEMGKVIGAVKEQAKGRADGALISRLVKEKLGG